jgi:hypothetical protein
MDEKAIASRIETENVRRRSKNDLVTVNMVGLANESNIDEKAVFNCFK